MTKIIITIVLLFLLVIFFSANAQVSTNLNNVDKITSKGKFNKVYKAEIDFEVPRKSIKELLEKEKTDYTSTMEDKPFRLATPIPIDIDIAKLANWSFDNKFAYGKFSIRLKGAFSASINFDKFNLPLNSEMYIYNENGNMITGPINENENNPNNVWGSWVYQGEYLNIEIKTPISTLRELILHSNNVAYGYKQVYQTETAGFGTSEACNINVICPLGTGWEAERNSVALVLNANGQDWCSGAMVMNTCNTNRPFFLTANHCFTGQNVTAWRFMFQAWSPTCPHPGINSNGVTYNGSTLRANWAGTDFCLVELNNTPPANSGINYAGWNRNTTGITQTTIIHHPQGDVMKISRDNQAPVFDNFSGSQCWRLGLDQGATQGGSSGSPYFDQNHRIIGQHYGIDDGNLPVCNRSRKFGGRFDLSLTGGGTNATRLSNWLDPSNSGLQTTNTTNISNLFPTAATFQISGNPSFCTGGSQYSVNAPAGATVNWQSSNQSIATVPPTGNPVTVTKVSDGVITLTATINLPNQCGALTTTRTITIGAPAIIYQPSGTPAFNLSGQRFNYGANGPGTSFSVCPNEALTFTPYIPFGYIPPNFTAHQWTITGSYSFANTFNQPILNVMSAATHPNTFQFTYRYQNVCGWSPLYYGSAGTMDCDGGAEPFRMGNFDFTLSPNPAKNDVVINLTGVRGTCEIKVFDLITSKQHKYFRFDKVQKQLRINLADLRASTYVVQITHNGKSKSKKLRLIK